MPRKAQKLSVELTVSRVSCPGVWLRNNNELYLSICLFGKYQRTSLVEPVFPAIFMEKFKYDKVFYTAVDPAEVSDCLEDEDVIFELVQLDPDSPEGAVLLASFQRNVRDFLYPYPQLLPSYGAADREILMDKSWDFPGIAPRLEFGSNAKIREVKVPKHIRSELEAEFSSVGYYTPKARARSPSPRTFVFPDSDEELKGYQEPTVSSITRSRSLSPRQRAKLKSLADRPPFLIRRTDESMIHRKPGSPNRKRKGKRTKSAQTSLKPHSTRSCGRVTRSVLDPPYYSDEESDVEYTGSYRRRQTRSVPEVVLPLRRSPSPLAYRRSLRERYIDSLILDAEWRRYLDNETVDEEWRRRRVERAERALAESLADSYRTRSVLSYTDSLDDLADEFDRSRLFGY